MTDNKKTDDSEDLFGDNSPDDITSIAGAIGAKNFKVAIFLFILFIFISSDVFIDRILSGKDSTYVDGRHTTGKGTIAQGLLLSLGYIIISVLVSCECI